MSAEHNAAQLERAIRVLGAHWVLHPANRVAKLETPLDPVFKWAPKVLPTKGRAKK